jgi:hypothetical protein
MPAKPRAQTKANRTFGINSGRERRIAEGNRQELSLDRRAEVFRQDVPHAGREPADVLRAHREAMWARVRELAAENKTLWQIASATGFAITSIRSFLSKHQLPCRDYKPQGRRGARST